MTHDPRSMADWFLGISPEHVQHMRILASRADPRTPTRPPWTWANLTVEEAQWLDLALDQFVSSYNHVQATRIEEVIPPCWRQHPGLTQELPVQLWAWWAAHLDEQSTVFVALDYYDRHLPAFKGRLSGGLLGKGAVNCRKTKHTGAEPDRSPLL